MNDFYQRNVQFVSQSGRLQSTNIETVAYVSSNTDSIYLSGSSSFPCIVTVFVYFAPVSRLDKKCTVLTFCLLDPCTNRRHKVAGQSATVFTETRINSSIRNRGKLS